MTCLDVCRSIERFESFGFPESPNRKARCTWKSTALRGFALHAGKTIEDVASSASVASVASVKDKSENPVIRDG